MISRALPYFRMIGVRASLSKLVRDYGLLDRDIMHDCISLDRLAFECVRRSKNPVLSNRECNHEKQLRLLHSYYIWQRLYPSQQKELTPKEAKRLVSSLKGTWTLSRGFWTIRKKLVLDGHGVGTLTEWRNKKISRRIRLSASSASSIDIGPYHCPRGCSSSVFNFIRLGPHRFLMSSNTHFSWHPVSDKTSFVLATATFASKLAIVYRSGQCNVFAIDTFINYPARCAWKRNRRRGQESFTIQYNSPLAGSRWKSQGRITYYLVKGMLVHEGLHSSLWKRRP